MTTSRHVWITAWIFDLFLAWTRLSEESAWCWKRRYPGGEDKGPEEQPRAGEAEVRLRLDKG